MSWPTWPAFALASAWPALISESLGFGGGGGTARLVPVNASNAATAIVPVIITRRMPVALPSSAS